MNYRRFFPLILVAGFFVIVASFRPTQAQPLSFEPEPNIPIEDLGDGPVAGFAASSVSDMSFLVGHDDSVVATEPAIGYNSVFNEYLVVWMYDRPGNDDIYGQYVSQFGILNGTSRAYAAGPGRERRHPDVVHNPDQNQYLLVWEDYDGSLYSIWGQFIDVNGDPTGQDFWISLPDAATHEYRPKVAYSSTSGNYLVVWESLAVGSFQGEIKGQLLDHTGVKVGGTLDIAAATWPYSHTKPELDYNRKMNEFLVVWEREDLGTTPSGFDVLGRIVRPDQTMPAEIIIENYVNTGTNPSVAAIPTTSANGRYLVVYEFVVGGDMDIWATVVFGNGSVGSDTLVSDSTAAETNPGIAGSESSNVFLVTWTQASQPPSTDKHIFGRNVDPDGNPWNNPEYIGMSYADNSAVAASGSLNDFLVAFDDVSQLTPTRDIYGRLWGYRVLLPLLWK